MNTLDRKMLRDLRALRGQAIAIAFVIVSGVATYVTFTATMDSLETTLAAYYDDYRFADVFASLRRAPERLQERLRQVPGVSQVQTRVVAGVNLEVPGFGEPVSGQIVSIPERGQPPLNRLYVRQGRLVQPNREDEVVLNEAFAEAHGLAPGDVLTAIINGRRKGLTVVGIALSPEFLMQIQPGSLFPDPARFGILWMGREALAAAYDMEGAFNSTVLSLAPGADIGAVTDRLNVLLAPYGSRGVQERADQPSHFYITAEFAQLRAMAALLPAIFLGVAAFLLNIVISRLISTQREQIAVLKAFGFSNYDVGLHYVKLTLLIAALGVVGGVALGIWLGTEMSALYMMYYRFPYLDFQLRPVVVLAAAALTAGASIVGVVQAVRKAVRLPPAEAMRPAPPARYRPTFAERIGLQRFFDQPTRMIARNLERQPVKSLLTIVGIACACAILIMGRFFGDAFDYIVDIQYGVIQQEDLTVSFTEPTSTAALYELKALPGVHHAEPLRSVPVRLHYAHRSYETALEGIVPDAQLRRVVDTDLSRLPIPREGLLLTDRLAEILGVRPGDAVRVEALEGSRRTRSVPVVGLAQQYMGLAAYMDLRAVNRLTGDGAALSGALLTIDARYEDALIRTLQRRPRVASIVAQQRAIQAFYESSAQMMLTFTFILTLFAGAIAFGVVYNSARIALSERDRELASLRVLGFTRGEIAYILLGELVLLALLAIPVGFALGTAASVGMIDALATDLYRIPVVLRRGTFTFAAVVVLACTAISALLVRRKLNQLDLIGVLKTRE